MVLVANKADLESDRVVSDTIRQQLMVCIMRGFPPYTQTLRCLLVCTVHDWVLILGVEFSFILQQVSFQEGEELAQQFKVQWY